MKKAVKERTVIQKERAEFFINGKNKMSVGTVNKFKGHFCRAINAVFVAASRAKFRMAAERNEFEFAAVGTAIHGTAIRRGTTINHLIDVFHNDRTWMKNVFNFFVVLSKNLLKDIHKSIMKKLKKKSNPSRLREGTEKVDYTVYIWYNVSIKYRRCFYDRTTAEIGAKSIHGNI